MRIAWLAPLLLAATSAASAAPIGEGSDQLVTYSCTDGHRITVRYDDRTATLTDARGRTFTLKQGISGSGTLHEGSGHTLRGKGDETVWTAPGAKPLTCNANALTAGFRRSQNDIIHEATGMVFPAQVGSAVREPMRPGDVEGEVAVVRYRVPIREGGEARVAIGIVHLEGMTSLQHYTVFRSMIMDRIPGAKVRHEGPFPVPGAVDEGRYGSFAGTDSAAGLIAVNFGYWSARLISRYPLAQLDEAQMANAAFVQAFDWSPLRNSPKTSLVGTRWQLAKFRSPDAAVGTIIPSDPSRYTLEFVDDQNFAMQLDCNRGKGRWSVAAQGASGGLSLGMPAMTRAQCPPGSMDTRIAGDLAQVRSYAITADQLDLTLEGGGVYSWQRMP